MMKKYIVVIILALVAPFVIVWLFHGIIIPIEVFAVNHTIGPFEDGGMMGKNEKWVGFVLLQMACFVFPPLILLESQEKKQGEEE